MDKKILDWKKYEEKSAEVVSEGIVMLENKNNALPLCENQEVAVFGRIQLHYYKSGTGSGGLVNVSRVVGVVDGLIERGIKINEELLEIYKKWDKENPFDPGKGWGLEPWSQEEMPVDDALCKQISEKTHTAIVIIGRTAGEDQDSNNEKGSYRLSDKEEEMLEKVRNNFKKMIVLLNVGGIMDMNFVTKYSPDAVLYIWQGGMVGGYGTADVLTGKVSPSGKLPDTIPYSIEDFPSYKNFGDKKINFYEEDIYVGYRYFETFAPEKVMYPFGFGLSYTDFAIEIISHKIYENKAELTVSVQNTGEVKGKEVVEIYAECPQGELGKSVKVLCGYEKTKLLEPNEIQTITFEINFSDFASYDDCGATGHKFCYVLEKGSYKLYASDSVRNCSEFISFELSQTKVLKQLSQVLAPVIPLKRMKPEFSQGKYNVVYENAPISQVNEQARRMENLPEEIPYTGDKGIKLSDVRNGKNTLKEFIAQLSDEDLSSIIKGEGMCSPRVTPGTAAAFGGVTDSLCQKGIPCGCCSDGPSGIRFDSGAKAFSLPNGTLIASTFNKEITRELFEFLGMEMKANKVDSILGPGINIHRHPLNGRNFEYFSEDPFLTGTMAAAQIKGLKSQGVSGTIKHFCANNQESCRTEIDTIVSERALREIYLKGYEMAVCDGKADSVMTSYNGINGVWSAGNFDLCTKVLRGEWGFDGIVMTDWWAKINKRGSEAQKTNLAEMAIAQNDLYMVYTDVTKAEDNVLDSLKKGTLTRGELQRNAENICSYLLKTNAMDILMDSADEVEIINRHEEISEKDSENIPVYKFENSLVIDGKDICTDRGSEYSFIPKLTEKGSYKIILTASSAENDIAQIPVMIYNNGAICGSFAFNGTNGKIVSYECMANCSSDFTIIKIYFAQSGLKLHSITIEKA